MCVVCLVSVLCGEWVVNLIVWVRGSIVCSNHGFIMVLYFNDC